MRFSEIPKFGATFTYRHKSGTRELLETKFFGFDVHGIATGQDLERAILVFVEESPGANKSAIKSAMEMEFESPGRNKIERSIGKLVSKGLLRESPGKRNSKEYRLRQ